MDDAMCDAELENEEGEDFAPPGHMAQMQESFVQIAANVRNSLNIQVFNQCYFLQFIHKLFDKPSSCSTLRLFQLASAPPSPPFPTCRSFKYFVPFKSYSFKQEKSRKRMMKREYNARGYEQAEEEDEDESAYLQDIQLGIPQMAPIGQVSANVR